MTAIAKNKSAFTTKSLTITAVFMGMNIALSSFGLTVPGGHLYLNDVIIVIAALLLNPFEAFLVGGVGAFLGDLLFYPTPMFVSLAVHGLQAVMISTIAHSGAQDNKKDWLAALVGAVIMVVGYTLGRAFVYSNPQTAMIKIPFQIFQALVGVAVGVTATHKLNLRKLLKRFIS